MYKEIYNYIDKLYFILNEYTINSLVIYYNSNMTDKRLEKDYNTMIYNINKRTKKQLSCMKRATNNPDYIYMLGNKCIKPIINSRKHRRHHKLSNKHNKKGKKSHRVKYRRRGGGVYQNVTNSYNGLISGIREEQPPPNVLPWEDNLKQNFSKV